MSVCMLSCVSRGVIEWVFVCVSRGLSVCVCVCACAPVRACGVIILFYHGGCAALLGCALALRREQLPVVFAGSISDLCAGCVEERCRRAGG